MWGCCMPHTLILRSVHALIQQEGCCRYVDMEGAQLQKAAILAGHSACITSITPLPQTGQAEQAKHMATTAEDGLLRIFRCPSAADPTPVGPHLDCSPPGHSPPGHSVTNCWGFAWYFARNVSAFCLFSSSTLENLQHARSRWLWEVIRGRGSPTHPHSNACLAA